MKLKIQLHLSILSAFLVLPAQADWPKVSFDKVVFDGAKGEKSEASQISDSLWTSEGAKLITKGKASYVLIQPGGSISRSIQIKPLHPDTSKNTKTPPRQESVQAPTESYMWIAADILGVTDAQGQAGVLSLILDVPDSGQNPASTDKVVTGTASPEDYVSVHGFAERPHNNRGASYALDGNPRTEWVSVFPQNKKEPPFIQLEFDEIRKIDGLRYLPRQGGLKNGQVYEYEILVRSGKDAAFEKVASGKWDTNPQEKLSQWSSPREVQAIRFVGLKTKPDSRQHICMSAAEVVPRYVINSKSPKTNPPLQESIFAVIPAEKLAALNGKTLRVRFKNLGQQPVLLGHIYQNQLPVVPPERKYKPRHSEFTDLNAIGLSSRTCPSELWPVTQVHNIVEGLAASQSNLQLGDLILAVGGESLQKPILNVTSYPKDVQWLKRHHEPVISRHYMHAIKTGGSLDFDVLNPRTGERQIKRVKLALSGKNDYDGFPLRGKAADDLYAELIERIRRDQKKNGSWGNMAANMGEAYGMLALLGTRDKKHADAIYRAADYLLGLKETGHESSYLELWSMAFKTIAMGEYALATGDPRAIAWLDNVCGGLTQGGHVNSRSYFAFGHDRRGLPYGNSGLIAPLSHIIVGDALAHRAGIRSNTWEYFHPYIKAAWADNMPFGKQCVGYGAPSSGGGADQAWCRSGLIGLTAKLMQTDPEMQRGIVAFMKQHHGFMRRSHGYGGLGTYLGLMALAGTDANAFEYVVNQWAPMIAMQWQKGNGLKHVEPQITNVASASGKGSDDAFSYTMAALLSVRNKGLHCTGATDTQWLALPPNIRPPKPVLIHRATGVRVARPSLLLYVTARYTTDGTPPTPESPVWEPEMKIEADSLTVAYQAKNSLMGEPSTIHLDQETPAQWSIVSATCGFPNDTVGLDVKKISITRARNAFDGNPQTAFRVNNSSTSNGLQTWTVVVDRSDARKWAEDITRVTIPTTKHERSKVNDSAKSVKIEASADGKKWFRTHDGIIPENRVVTLKRPIHSRYIRFTFTSYSLTNLIVPDLKFGFKRK